MPEAQFLPENNGCNIYLKKENGYVLLCDEKGKVIPCQYVNLKQSTDTLVTAEVSIEVNGWFEDIGTQTTNYDGDWNNPEGDKE